MSSIIGYIVLLVLVFPVTFLIKKPSIAVGYLLTLYAAEQILFRHFSFFLSHVSLYNYIVGAIGISAIIISIFRSGMPWISPILTPLFLGLLIFSWMSLQWTMSPNSAYKALIHFTYEGTLAIFLPYFMFRQSEDFIFPSILIVTIASISSLHLILYPIETLSGRTVLFEGATPLSTAELIGASIIILLVADLSDRIFLNSLRIILLALLIIASAITGARTQFVAALLIGTISYLFLRQKSFSKKVLSTLVLIGVIFVLGYIFSDLFMSSFSKRFATTKLVEGWNARTLLISTHPSYKLLDNIVLGKGIMGWAYDTFNEDIYQYPHNSIFQIFYELGIIGLIQFLLIVLTGIIASIKAYKKAQQISENSTLIAATSAYFTYSFILSLKQGTFMSCTGVYIGASILVVLSRLCDKQNTNRH